MKEIIRNIMYKKIKMQNSTIIVEQNSFSYALLVYLIKIGFFGKEKNKNSVLLYKLTEKILYNKSNEKYKNNEECANLLKKFMNNNYFTDYQKNIILKKDLTLDNYPCFNSFFTREIDLSLFPIPKNDGNGIYSPAECRARFLTSDKSFEVKHREIMLEEIGFNYNMNYIILCRLALTDCHRFYAPVTGKITKIYSYTSNLNISVNEALIPEFNPYGLNSRKIITIDNKYGIIEMAVIGATFVDDIVLNINIGDEMIAGQEIGLFNYGSCIIINLNNMILKNIFKINDEYEIYLQVRNKLGNFKI